MVVVVGVVVMAVVGGVGGGGVAVTQSHIRILASFVQVLGQVRLVFGAPGWELQVGGRRRRLEVEVGGWSWRWRSGWRLEAEVESSRFVAPGE